MLRNLIALGLVATALTVAVAQDVAPNAPPDDVAQRVAKALAAADPLAEGAAPADLLAPANDVQIAVWAMARSDATTEPSRSRALHLLLAWEMVDRIRDQAKEPGLSYWLALDEIDRLYAKGPRETLLARALPDAKARDAALTALAAARDVAKRFSLEWDEIEAPGSDVAKRHAAQVEELRRTGLAAVPSLFEILAVPPQAAFTVMDPERGATARQQVRASFALGFLSVRDAAPHLVFQAHGPSFTSCTTAQSHLRALTGADLGPGADEATVVKAIDEWWAVHRAEFALATDHLVRATLRWTRGAIQPKDKDLDFWAALGPRQLQRLVGPLPEIPPDGDVAARQSKVDAIETLWLRNRFALPSLADRATSVGPWEPFAATSGTSKLRLECVVLEPPDRLGGDPFLSLQGAIEADGTDVLLAGGMSFTSATPRRPKPVVATEWCSVLSATWRTFAVNRVPLPAGAEKLTVGELRCRIVRVRTWTTTTLAVGGEKPAETVAAPFRLFCTPEPTRVSVCATMDPGAVRIVEKDDVASVLGHRWASSAAEVTDATGVALVPHGGAGTGGASVATFADAADPAREIAYPVKVRLRVPCKIEVEDAVFRLDGLALPKWPPLR